MLKDSLSTRIVQGMFAPKLDELKETVDDSFNKLFVLRTTVTMLGKHALVVGKTCDKKFYRPWLQLLQRSNGSPVPWIYPSAYDMFFFRVNSFSTVLVILFQLSWFRISDFTSTVAAKNRLPMVSTDLATIRRHTKDEFWLHGAAHECIWLVFANTWNHLAFQNTRRRW